MATKRQKPEEIVTKLRQVEVLVGQGMAQVDAIHEIHTAEQTYNRWGKQYGGTALQPGNHCSDGPEAAHAPTLKPDHLGGADHH